MEAQGFVKAFEYTYELSRKTLQDILKDKGYGDVVGPRPVIEQSFQDGYLLDGKGWMKMHKSRTLTNHTSDEDTAREIVEDIRHPYFELLSSLKKRLDEEY